MKYSELKNRFKNKYVIRIVAGVLTIAMLGTGYGAYSVSAAKATDGESVVSTESSTETTDTDEVKQELEDKLGSMISDQNQSDIGKEETVYMIADANGNVNNTIVSDWLINKDNADTLEDASDLKDITNVKGDEEFTQDGNKLSWAANGSDIFYQGTTDKESPISEKVTYFLDGEEIAAEDLAGKSGNVTIRFDYTNNEKTTTTINGKKTDIYVPFSVMTGMVLDNSFSNVEVTNGKIISDGKNNIVVGIAMPGLQESLGVDADDFDTDVEFPDYVEVTADVEDFELETTVTVATSNLMSELSMNGDLDLSFLSDTIDEMTDASTQLVDGSSKLSDGIKTLKEGIDSYTSGASTIDGYMAQLNNAAGTLGTSATTLNTGMTAVNNGIATLDKTLNTKMTEYEKNALLKQVDETISSQKSTIEKSATDSVAAQKKTIEKTATDGVTKQKSTIEKTATDGVTAQQSEIEKAAEKTVADSADAIKKQVSDSVAAQKSTIEAGAQAGVDATFGSATDATSYYNQLKSGAAAQITAADSDISKGMTAYTQGVVSASVSATMKQVVKQTLLAGGATEEVAEAQASVAITQDPYASQISAIVNGILSDPQLTATKDGVIATLADGISTQIVGAAYNGASTAAKTAAVSAADQVAGTAAVQAATSAAKQAAVAGAQGVAGTVAYSTAQSVAGSVAYQTAGEVAKSAAYTGASQAAAQTAVTVAEQGKSTIAAAIEKKDEATGFNLVTLSSTVAQGTATLESSAPTLVNAVSQLKTGADTLVSNNGKLTSGVTELLEGSVTLADGMEEFDEEAIEKLADTYNGDVKSLLDRVDAVMQAGEDYTTFSDVADGVNGSVKFIIRTDAVKAE